MVVGAFASNNAFASPKIGRTNHHRSRHLSSTPPQSSDDDFLDGIAASDASREQKNFFDVLLLSKRDIDAAPVKIALDRLSQTHTANARTNPSYDGDWQMETLPTFPELLGCNEEGDALHTMGRLTHNMIKPANIICSIQNIAQHTSSPKIQFI
jgi:hypothetical protein